MLVVLACCATPVWLLQEDVRAVNIQVFGRAVTRSLTQIALSLPDFTDKSEDPYFERRAYAYSKTKPNRAFDESGEFPKSQDEAIQKLLLSDEVTSLLARHYRLKLDRFAVASGAQVRTIHGEIRFVSRPALHYLSPKERAARLKQHPMLKGSWERAAERRKSQIEGVKIRLDVPDRLAARIDRRKLGSTRPLEAKVEITDFVVRGIDMFGGYAAEPRIVEISARVVDLDHKLLRD